MTTIGFIGLGRMGYGIAKNIQQQYNNTYVWNRNYQIAVNHSKECQTKACKDITTLAENSNIILLCLPTYREVEQVLAKITHHLYKTQFIIDCTSSEPDFQRKMAQQLKVHNIYYFDSPVSGGPEKAYSGQLTAMVSGDAEQYQHIKPVLSSFSNPIFVGKIGNACAIKSINNILNVSHLCLAAEGLQALKKLGIKMETALEVINQSSGRSLATQERIPRHILQEDYQYGFSLGLMNKDVNIALQLIDNPVMFEPISKLLNTSLSKYGEQADYTEIAKIFLEDKNETK